MNSSFLAIAHHGLVLWMLLKFILNWIQFKPYRDSMALLNTTVHLLIFLFFLGESLIFQGIILEFYIPNFYSACLGALAIGSAGYFFLSHFRKVGTLRNKLGWQLLLLGALLGVYLGKAWTPYLFGVSFASLFYSFLVSESLDLMNLRKSMVLGLMFLLYIFWVLPELFPQNNIFLGLLVMFVMLKMQYQLLHHLAVKNLMRINLADVP